MEVDQRNEAPADGDGSDEPTHHRQERARFSELSLLVRVALMLAVILLTVVVGGNVLVNCVGLSDNDTGVLGGGPVSPELTAPAASTARQSPPAVLSLPPLTSPIPTSSASAASGDVAPPGLILSQPADVAMGQPIVIAGTYGGHDNVELQIQRLEGGVWADFPAFAQVSMGHFNALITSSTPGQNQIRVYDQGPGRASNIVTVNVH